jgi:hypothetical protein
LSALVFALRLPMVLGSGELNKAFTEEWKRFSTSTVAHPELASNTPSN